MLLKSFKILVVTVTLVLLSIIAAGCGQTEKSSSTNTPSTQTKSTETKPADTTPIKIGLLSPLSGPSASYGEPALQGATIAVEEINKNGGINGRKLELLARDDEAKPTTGVVQTQELINNEKIVGMVGPSFSSVALAITQYTSEAKVPNLIIAAAKNLTDQSKFPYTFRWVVPDRIFAQTLVDYAVKNNITKIAIFADTTEFGISGTKITTELMASKGLKPVAVETMNPGALDLTSQMKRIKDSGAQAYIGWMLGLDIVHALKAKQQVGWKDGIVLGPNYANSSIVNGAGPEALGNVYASVSKAFVNPAPERTLKLQKSLKEKYGKILYLDMSSKYYDMVYILAEAVKRAGTTDGAALKAEIEKMEGYEAILGKVHFTKESHESGAIEDLGVAVTATLKDGLLDKAPGQ